MSRKQNRSYEKEFPTLNEVTKDNSNSKSVALPVGLVSYSARLKTYPTKNKQNDLNIEGKERTQFLHRNNASSETENLQSVIHSSHKVPRCSNNSVPDKKGPESIECNSKKIASNVSGEPSEQGWTIVRKKCEPITQRNSCMQKSYEGKIKNSSPTRQISRTLIYNIRQSNQNAQTNFTHSKNNSKSACNIENNSHYRSLKSKKSPTQNNGDERRYCRPTQTNFDTKNEKHFKGSQHISNVKEKVTYQKDHKQGGSLQNSAKHARERTYHHKGNFKPNIKLDSHVNNQSNRGDLQNFQSKRMKSSNDNFSINNDPNKKLFVLENSGPSKDKGNFSRKENSRKLFNKTDVAILNSIAPNKKKAKAKVKQQTNLPSGKVQIITPEIHSKILDLNNQSSVLQPQRKANLNINDCFEYPELHSDIQTTKSKHEGASTKIEILDEAKKYLKKNELNKDLSEKSVITTPGKDKINKTIKNPEEIGQEDSSAVHYNDPITVSLFDMLIVNKFKKKESDKSISHSMGGSFHKINSKKQPLMTANRQIVNPLDSSKPAVKRGKERENPKPKKPSQLKKIILMDRKKRKEKILSLSDNNNPLKNGDLKVSFFGSQSSVAFEPRIESMEGKDIYLFENFLCSVQNECSEKMNNFTVSNVLKTAITDSESLSTTVEGNVNADCKENSEYWNNKCNIEEEGAAKNKVISGNKYSLISASMCDPLNLEPSKKGIKNQKCKNTFFESCLSDIRYLFQCKTEAFHEQQLLFEAALSDLQYLFKNELMDNDSYLVHDMDCGSFSGKEYQTYTKELCTTIDKSNLKNTKISPAKQELPKSDSMDSSNFSLDVSLNKNIEGASLIILHSKKFREYCTHFVDKDLEDAVLALLGDLARFQDRMHQKDPVKARMKRRLVYGIREIKRHMKLKKLKCIVIATDVEDSKTEGGLNDLLNDLKSLAKDHHIPCIFSLTRRKLGQVCHKPAPVSAVGVFNYDGSEVNFRKMLEFQNECRNDYVSVTKALSCKLTQEQIKQLHETKEVNKSNLHNLTMTLLRNYFPKPDEKKSDKGLVETATIMLKESSSSLKDQLKEIDETSIYNILYKYKIANY